MRALKKISAVSLLIALMASVIFYWQPQYAGAISCANDQSVTVGSLTFTASGSQCIGAIIIPVGSSGSTGSFTPVSYTHLTLPTNREV